MRRVIIPQNMSLLSFFVRAVPAVSALVFSAAETVWAQPEAVDSLEKVVAKAGMDTVKARALCRLCDAMRIAGRGEEALKNGEAGRTLALRLNDDAGVAECLNGMGNVAHAQGDYALANERFLQSLKIYEALGDKQGVAKCLNNLGNACKAQGNYEPAAEHFQKALKIRQTLGDKLGVAKCLNNLGNVYAAQGDYVQAVERYFHALKIFEALSERKNAADCLNSLGAVYGKQGKYGLAGDYFRKALKIKEEDGDKKGVAACLNNLGNVANLSGEHKQAAEHFQNALKIYEGLGARHGIARCVMNLGNAYAAQGAADKAADCYRQALAVFDGLGDKNGVALCRANLSDFLLLSGRAAEARDFARKGLTLATEIGNVEAMQLGAGALARADSAVGDYKAAFEHYKLYKTLSDSLNNDEQHQKIARLEARRQFELEAAERRRQEEIAAEHTAEQRERTYMFQSLGIFAFLMLMIVSLFFLGKLNLPRWTIKGLLYVSLMMTFEFFILLFDPLNEKYSEGLPIYKMAFNTVLALVVGPFHVLAERKLTERLIRMGKSKNAAVLKTPYQNRN